MSRTHSLKTLTLFFDAVISGRKTFEIRRNDREFAVGDILRLREWTGTAYTGRECFRRITYMTEYEQQAEFVVLGIVSAAPEQPTAPQSNDIDDASRAMDASSLRLTGKLIAASGTPVAWVVKGPGGSVYHLSVQDGWTVDPVVFAPQSAAPAPERCPICKYQHGHQIGCENNPVDQALKQAAPQSADPQPDKDELRLVPVEPTPEIDETRLIETLQARYSLSFVGSEKAMRHFARDWLFLTTPVAPQSTGPVAWRKRWPNGEYSFTDDENIVAMHEGYEPLFAHPERKERE